MKKILVFLVAFVMVLGICGCSKKDDKVNNNQAPENNTTTQPTQSTTKPTNSERMVTVPLSVFNSNNEIVDVGTFTFEYNGGTMLACKSNAQEDYSYCSTELGFSKSIKQKIETGMFDYIRNLNNMAIYGVVVNLEYGIYLVNYSTLNDYNSWDDIKNFYADSKFSPLNIGYENFYTSTDKGTESTDYFRTSELIVNLSDEYYLIIHVGREVVPGEDDRTLIMDIWNSFNFNVPDSEFIKLYTQYRYTGN